MPPVFTKMENALSGTFQDNGSSLDDIDNRKRKEAATEVILDLETDKFFEMTMIWCRSASIDSEQSDGDYRRDTKIADHRSTRLMLRIPTIDHDRSCLTPSSSEDLVDGGFGWTPAASGMWRLCLLE